MAYINVSELKAMMKITVADYDSMLTDMINYAYSKIDNWATVTTGDKFQEWGDVSPDGKILLSGCGSDIALTAGKLDGVDIVPATDLTVVRPGLIEIKNSDYSASVVYFIEYTSAKMLSRVRKTAMEIAIFETIKLPAFDNFIGRRSFSVNGGETQVMMTDDQFYGKISRDMSEIFLKKG